MSLDRKDVRLKISDAAHRELVALAEFHQKDISELASEGLEEWLLGRAHTAKVYAERVAKWGRTGSQSGEPAASPGNSGHRLRKV
jgi:hypothetical protein